MNTYSHTELLRIARIRTDLVPAQRWLDLAEANRLAAKARSEAIHGALRAAGRIVGRVVGRLATWKRYRTALAELETLDPRMLHDIGITRSEIPRVAAGLWVPETPIRTDMPERAVPAGNDNARQAAA